MVNASSLVSCKGSRAVINLSKDVISQLMQDSLCLYCHQKGQSCVPLFLFVIYTAVTVMMPSGKASLRSDLVES